MNTTDNVINIVQIFKFQIFLIIKKSDKLIKVRDLRWTVSKSVEQVQQDNYLQNMLDNVVFLGILNRNNSTYATSCIQCLINCKYIRQIMTQQKEKNVFHQIYHAYVIKSSIDIKSLCQFVNAKYLMNGEYDASQFLEDIFLSFKYFDNIVNYQLNILIRCPACDLRVEHQNTNRIFKLTSPKESKTYTLQNIVDYNIGDFKDTDEYICDTCNMKKLKKTSIQIYNNNSVAIIFGRE